jgi:hypothetical protein
MHSPGVLPRWSRMALVVGAFLWSTLATFAVAQGPPPGKGDHKKSSENRPPYAGVKDPAERRSLLESWRSWHKSAPAAPGVTTDVGRASMVINSANTVIFTSNTLGGTCDVFDVRAQNTWVASHAYAAGAVVAPTASFGNPNGFDGFNFQANNAGTSGATEPTWPTSGIGATVGDNGITWKAIAFDPANFVGCTPMQLVSQASGGAQTVVAQEGDTLADGSQLAGWSEFIAANASGKAAFRAALAGYPFSDRDDEGESGIFTAGPGAGALTRIAATSTTIGGRTVCGFSAMVGINGAGQVVFDTLSGLLSTNNECDENNHGLVRFTSGPGNELLVQVGDSIGTPAATVVGFGKDVEPGGGARCTTCIYQNFDGLINSAGHVPVVLSLSDGTQGVFTMTGPGTATQIVRLPTGSIGPRTSINDTDQVTYRATTGGVDHIFRFTPPATITTIASVGDTIGGQTISSLAAFTDINSSGNLVFEGQVAGGTLDAYFFWNGASSLITTGPVTAGVDSLNSEMITVNDSNLVAYVTGPPSSHPDEVDGGAEGHEGGGLFTWTSPGPPVKLIAVGDVVGGQTVSAIYAQHTSFVRRQFNSQGCAAMAYMVAGDDPEMDCTEGDQTAGCYAHGVQLFLNCAGSICPTITLSPPTLPGATQGTMYSQLITASPAGTYTFTETGALPTGITLAASGLLSGTPTVQGSFPITVTATDANNCTGNQAYTLVVGPPAQPSITLTPPNDIVVVGSNGTLRVSINITQSTDTVVTLSSGNTAIVTVPAAVTIPANQASVTFPANGVTVGGPVTITANLPPSFGAPPATSSVTVVAVPAAQVPTLNGWGLAILAFAIAASGILLMRK